MTLEWASVSDRAGVQNALQHRVEVKALVDAQAGLGQPGQPVPQLRYLPLPLFGLVHLPALTGPQTACSSLDSRRARPCRVSWYTGKRA